MAAVNGTMVFMGLNTGTIYSIDVYIPDSAGSNVTFGVSGNAASTSNNYWRTPEPVQLRDISIASGLVTTVALVPLSNDGLIPGYRWRLANFLSSITTRPSINIAWDVAKNVGFLTA